MDMRRSIVAVALAGVMMLVAVRIPLPGLDMAAVFDRLSPLGGLHHSLSIFALGLMPLYTALIIVELGRLFVRSRAGQACETGAMERVIVVVITLAYTVFQGHGLVAGLGGAGFLSASPTTAMLLGLGTYIGFSTLTIILAYRIRMPGFRNAFLAMWSVLVLFELPSNVWNTVEIVRTGAIPANLLLVMVGYLVLCFAAVAFAMLVWKSACVTTESGHEATAPMEVLIWPSILTTAVLNVLLQGFAVYLPDQYGSLAASDLLEPAFLLLRVLLIALFVCAYMRQNRIVLRPGTPLGVIILIIVVVQVGIIGLDAVRDMLLPTFGIGPISVLALAVTALALGRAEIPQPVAAEPDRI